MYKLYWSETDAMSSKQSPDPSGTFYIFMWNILMCNLAESEFSINPNPIISNSNKNILSF